LRTRAESGYSKGDEMFQWFPLLDSVAAEKPTRSPMIHSWRVGDATVTSLVEYAGPTHAPEATFPAFDQATFDRREAELPRGMWYSHMRRFAIAIQIWILKRDGETILVDSGVGNRKVRPAARMHLLNTLVPQWLVAANASPDSVTHVLMTHLHADHVGWNTTLDGERWAPTFPKARYLVPKTDFEYFKGLRDSGKTTDASFADSLAPVVDAGLVDFIDARSELPGGLEPIEAFGHTPGQMNYWLRSEGETGVFSADVFHHPVQILNPAWNTVFCVLSEAASATRAKVLGKAAAAGALVMPCHFPAPHTGYVRRTGDAYRFEPAPPGSPDLT
jgi:glyoxylase-like metal-dependent hydrolase (beta-lactamase superfamily II)